MNAEPLPAEEIVQRIKEMNRWKESVSGEQLKQLQNRAAEDLKESRKVRQEKKKEAAHLLHGTEFLMLKDCQAMENDFYNCIRYPEDSDCWIWVGKCQTLKPSSEKARTKRPRLNVCGKSELAVRIAWVLHNQKNLPRKVRLYQNLKVCNDQLCINPEHHVLKRPEPESITVVKNTMKVVDIKAEELP